MNRPPLEDDPAGLVVRLRRALAVHARARMTAPDGFRPAAVLVPIVTAPAATLVFTERHADLPQHAGQISFPGGKSEAGDAGPEATALRELEEEIGVPAASFEPIGRLGDVLTPTGFHITPVVGVTRGPIAPRPNPREVAALFTVSLGELLDPSCYRQDGAREFLGVRYDMHEYHVAGRRIWGATARMVHQLVGLLR